MDLQPYIETLRELVVVYGVNLISALAIFIIGKWVARRLANFFERLMTRSKLDHTLAKFVKDLAYVALLAFVVIAALNRLGVQTASLIAVVGAAGLAVGLALQGSLANFSAGVMLIIFKPFGIGDFIEAGGTMGSVQEIQIFNTILSSPDNRRIIVPNSNITGSNITNFSAIEKRRIDLVFSIGYGDDMKKAQEILLNLVKSDSRVLGDPEPLVAVSELADNSVNLVCRPWVKPADYWGVYFDVVEKGKVALEAAGLSIPYPQRDVHLYPAQTESGA